MAITSSKYAVTARPVSILAHLLGMVVIILVLVWVLHFEGGLAFKSENKKKILNLHAVFMILGPVLAAGEAIMVYQTVKARKRTQKLVHLTFHFIGLLLGILGIYAIFKFHNEVGMWNMFTLHSWLGTITICSFGFQWLLGFFTYFFPGAEKSSKSTLIPSHIYTGMVIFVLAVCSTEIGLAQAFISLGLGRTQEAVIVNFTGLFVFLFAASVGLTVFLPRGD